MTDILFNIQSPILALVALGALMHWLFELHIPTLSKLNIYLFVPGFVFYNVATSTLDFGQMVGVSLATATHVVALAVLVFGVGQMLGVDRRTLAAVALAVMFYNSGNYGIPLAELAFPRDKGIDGAAVQAFVVLTQNVLTFTLGAVIASMAGTGSLGAGLGRVLRLPAVPVLVIALLTRWWLRSDPSNQMPTVIRTTGFYLSMGMVPLALVTLGAQLARNPRWPRWKPVSVVIVLRLILGPILMAGILWMYHRHGPSSTDLWNGPHQVLILTAGVPTAVNTLLLSLELDGDPTLVADCVFWTTLLSLVSVTAWLVVVRAFL